MTRPEALGKYGVHAHVQNIMRRGSSLTGCMYIIRDRFNRKLLMTREGSFKDTNFILSLLIPLFIAAR